MKTLHDYFRKVVLILIVTILTMTLYAQKSSESESLIVHLDPVSVDENYVSFKKMVSNIVAKKDFNYRKTLRRAKASKKQYVFSGKAISEVEILKHFKKAARKSVSVDEFRNYLFHRELAFIEVLNEKTVSRLYTTIRATTFEGYLDDLEALIWLSSIDNIGQTEHLYTGLGPEYKNPIYNSSF